MKDRIKMVRKGLGLTQEEFGNAIGATRGMVTAYERGSIPTLSTRLLICKTFHVSERWLETGEGEPYEEDPATGLARALARMPDVQALLERLLTDMTETEMKTINDAARVIAGKMED